MTLEKLRILKDEFSDEIPNRTISSYRPDKKFKVRRNWWQAVTSVLEKGLDEDIVPEKSRPDVESFVKHYTSAEFRDQPLTTKEDIRRANELLSKVLNTG